jgi:hypothetical protein
MYRLNEGSIDLPKDWKDQSINIVSSTGGSGFGLSFTISRDDIPWGMNFAEYVKDEIGKAKEALNDFTIVGQQDLEIHGAPAVEIECTWKAKQAPMHQIITTVQNESRALVLTASMPGKMSDSQKTEVRRITATLKFNGKEAESA